MTKSAILEKYGNAAATEPAPEGLLLGQTEGYVEYDRAGRVIKGQERAVAKSRYEEDVHEQNHTKVWGSFWQAGRWGYACCRSFQKNSYCTGKKGLDAADAAADLMKENLAARQAAMEARRGEEEEAAAREANEGGGADGKGKKTKNPFDAKKDVWGGDVAEDVQLDPKKLAEALRREDARERGEGGAEGGDERKRGYNVSHEVDVTEEDMEAYRMKRQRKDDPMNAPDAGTDGYDLV